MDFGWESMDFDLKSVDFAVFTDSDLKSMDFQPKTVVFVDSDLKTTKNPQIFGQNPQILLILQSWGLGFPSSKVFHLKNSQWLFLRGWHDSVALYDNKAYYNTTYSSYWFLMFTHPHVTHT